MMAADPREIETNQALLGPDGKVDENALRAACERENPEDESPRRVAFRLTRDRRRRLDQYLTDRVPFLSRSRVQKLIDEDAVTVNGGPCKASTVLRLGDLVEVLLPPPRSQQIAPEPIPLDVLHEDDELIVVNKPPGIIVHPARSHFSGTMLNALAWRFQNASAGDLSSVGEEFARPGVVHRLDRDTSGVIVFAKQDEAHWRLGRQFEKRTVEKRYIALVHGDVDPPADVIDLPIGPHPNRAKGYREKFVVRHDEWGKPSVTIYRALERFDGYSLLEVELRTGRTHQIRVHLSHRGWPIVGDDMYGGRHLSAGDVDPRAADPHAPLLTRQALHAALLSFDHPNTHERMRFIAPPPADLHAVIDALRRHRPGPGPTGVDAAAISLDDLTGETPSPG